MLTNRQIQIVVQRFDVLVLPRVVSLIGWHPDRLFFEKLAYTLRMNADLVNATRHLYSSSHCDHRIRVCAEIGRNVASAPRYCLTAPSRCSPRTAWRRRRA